MLWLSLEEMQKKLGMTNGLLIGNPIPGLPLLQARINGFISVLKAKRPGLKVAGPFNVGNELTQRNLGLAPGDGLRPPAQLLLPARSPFPFHPPAPMNPASPPNLSINAAPA